MSRGLSSGFKTELGQGCIYPAMFVEFQFDNTTTRFWSGESNISADLGDGSVSWTGGGLLGGVETSGESEDLQSRQLVFTLNGVDQSYYSTAISSGPSIVGRTVKLWFALMDSTGATVQHYELLEEANMDRMVVDEGDEAITLVLTCESEMVDFFTPARSFLNNVDLQKDYPTDTFYKDTPTLPSRKMPWGMVSSYGSTSGSVGGSVSGGYRVP